MTISDRAAGLVKHGLFGLTSAAALLLLQPGSQAFAQSSGFQMEEIMVTARKRVESLQDVPISVSTFSSAQLDRLSATSLKDVKNFVPGLYYSDRSALQTDITIRGVGGDSRNIGIESGTGLYVDGVYAGRTSAYNMDLADVAQIEILRGPQGTLFGKNTMGGVINIVTRKPTEVLSGNAEISYGNYNAIRFKGSVSGPLTDKLLAKATVATWDRDGYLHNLFDDSKLQSEKRRSGMLQFQLKPSDALEINLSGDYTHDDQNAVLNQLGSAAAFGAGYYNPNRFEVNTNRRNSIERDMYGFALSANYTLGSGHTLTSISSFRHVDITVYSDIDQVPVDVFHSGPFTDNFKQYTQELRISSPGQQFIDYLVGLYYYKQDASASRNIYASGNPIFFTRGPLDTTSFAGFANVTANFTPKLAVTAGVRATYEKKEGSYQQTSPTPAFNKNFPDLRISSTEPSWTLSANYRWVEEVSTFLSVSRGFKSGGFNVDPLATPAPLTNKDITFDSEFVTSYEAGLKSELLGGKLRLSASVFYSEYKDRQVPQFETIGGIPTVITRNAGASEVKGFEVEFTAVPNQWLLVFGGLGYLDGKYTEFAGATTSGQNFTGHITEKTPKWSANIGVDMRVPVGPGELSLSPQLAYVGKTYLQPDNLPFNIEHGYTLVNVRLGYEFQDGQYGIFAWGKNLTNATYKEFTRQFSGSDQVLFGEPRTYGVQLNAKF
ncbi:TonB-dependent receptor [Govanella unica]|uniref:TonB-dependent receptor n=1 Tax=Govanella unica TaxID=2975056 RepID=A0A9X3U066_9PROT|nr:TonB-dependent receptor [Govania unica]MDA5195013.1 TonB-dependent receptor [Govania unica]